ncbi:MAG: hypothetical protein ABI663_08400 [Chryseolinea sp.]
MRKTAAIVFLFIYLSVNTELHQVFRLPVFFQHYFEHRKGNEDITFLNFIMLHYSGNAVQHDDHDSELPFKSNHCDELLIAIALPPDNFFESVVNDFPVADNSLVPSSQFISSSFLFSIWQPPRA